MDIRSMTGFGRSESSDASHRLTVELKSVNSRFLDLNIKMPKKFNALEAEIRNTIKKFIGRGKVDLYITYEDFSENASQLHCNEALAEEYLMHINKLSEKLGLDNDIRLSMISRMPDVMSLSEESSNDDELQSMLIPVLTDALEAFVKTRVTEGENLRQDLIMKLQEMSDIVGRIDERAPEITAQYEKKLRDKVTELLGTTGIDENRIVQEVTIYSDKICTDEERVRLHSHIKTMTDKLNKGGAVGRELDFLAQEMNREANTTLSKANDLIVSEDAISLKTLIEKIREQIQNLE